jgi:hypothetical protein
LEKENMAERHPDTDKRLTLIFLIPKGKSTEKVLFVVNQTLKHAPGY